MKQIVLVTLMALSVSGASVQKWVGVPENRFAVTVKIDLTIASEPQKMYMYSMIEREMQLHDSISFDSLHREGTMHGYVPYEYNVNLMLQRRGRSVCPS